MAKEVKTKEELVRENADLKEENEELKRQLAVLKRAAFGQKSEKRSVESCIVKKDCSKSENIGKIFSGA